MRCTSPITAWRSEERDEGTKKREGTFKRKIVFNRDKVGKHAEILLLPCGKCNECRIQSAKNWGIRCYHEAFMNKENCFITLTYNNENLPEDASLRKKDLQDFMKRLRKHYTGKKIRYFACGEYGKSVGHRPHYHICIFGHDFEDKYTYKTSKTGSILYRSNILEKLWTKGFSDIGEVNEKSANYAARYCLKKHKGRKGDLDYEEYYNGREPEFVVMSKGKKKDGTKWLGYEFVKKYGEHDIFNNDIVVIENQIVGKPPKRYMEHLELTDQELYDNNKLKRKKYVQGVPHETPKEQNYRRRATAAKLKLLKREGVENGT